MTWGESALRAYGVRTIVFDTMILVDTPELASKELERNGFHRIATDEQDVDNPELYKDAIRLVRSRSQDDTTDGAGHTANGMSVSNAAQAVALLPAAVWHFPISLLTTNKQSMCPPLHEMVSSLTDTWLDAKTLPQICQLRTYLSYVKAYVPVTLESSFVGTLRHQYHQDFWKAYQEGDIKPRQRSYWCAKRATCMEAGRISVV